MFLSKPGEYAPCGTFNIRHLILLIGTLVLIMFAVKFTKIEKKEDVKLIIRRTTILMWALEIFKVLFVINSGQGFQVNKIVPLYYCSLLLYSGIFSSFGKGNLRRVGDVFLATGRNNCGSYFYCIPNNIITRLSNATFYKPS